MTLEDIMLKSRLEEYLAQLPPMEIRPGMKDEWRRTYEINQEDEYSKAAVDMVEPLARLLQPLVSADGDRRDQFHMALCIADSVLGVDITGFQADCIKSILRKVWVYGDTFFPRKEEKE